MTDQSVGISKKLTTLIEQGEAHLREEEEKERRENQENAIDYQKAWDRYRENVRRHLPEELRPFLYRLNKEDLNHYVKAPKDIDQFDTCEIRIPGLMPIWAHMKRTEEDGEVILYRYSIAGIAIKKNTQEPIATFESRYQSGAWNMVEALGKAKIIGQELAKKHGEWEEQQKLEAERKLQAHYEPIEEPTSALINMDEWIKTVREVVKEDRI